VDTETGRPWRRYRNRMLGFDASPNQTHSEPLHLKSLCCQRLDHLQIQGGSRDGEVYFSVSLPQSDFSDPLVNNARGSAKRMAR